MDETKEDTHIDNLLSLLGAKSDENKQSEILPYGGRGTINPPFADQNIASRGTPTSQQNQQAMKNMMSDAGSTIANADFGSLDPRQVAYVPGAVAGMKYGQTIYDKFDPLIQKERELDRLLRTQFVNEGGFPENYGVRSKINNGSMTRNYGSKLSNVQMPEAVLSQATDMTSGHPMGTGAHDIAAKDAENMAKIRSMGHGDYELVGEGLPSKTPKPFQLMMPSESIPTKVVSEIPKTESSILKFLKAFPEHAGAFLQNPIIKHALHGANIAGTAVQGATDVYNKDPIGGLITAGQIAGSMAGFPEVAIPVAEAARYARTMPPVTVKKTNAFVNRGFGLD